MPPRSNSANIKRTGRMITALVLLLMLTMVGWTVLFLYGVLNSATSTGDAASSAAAGAETLNTDLLDKIEKRMIDKVSRPIPQIEDLRNPFLIPAAAPAPEPPAAEPPAAVPAPTPPETVPPPVQ